MTAAPNTASTAVRTLGQPVSRRLGDVLVAQGLITQDGLARAIAAQKGTSERLGSVLLRLNLVAEEQLLGSLSRQYGVPSITVSQLEIDPEALNLVPAQIAKKHAVLPIKRVGNMLTLAMADPTDVFALDNVAFMTNLQILPLVASQVAIREGIERHYEGQTSGITDIVSELNSGASPDVEVVDEGDEAATKIDWPTPSRRAPATSTGSLTRRSSASGSASTACCTRCSRYPRRWRRRPSPDSRSCRTWISPSAGSPRTAASSCATTRERSTSGCRSCRPSSGRRPSSESSTRTPCSSICPSSASIPGRSSSSRRSSGSLTE